jgi:hypothetical protein
MVYYMPFIAQSQRNTAISITPFMIMEQGHYSLSDGRIAVITTVDFPLIIERASRQIGDIQEN